MNTRPTLSPLKAVLLCGMAAISAKATATTAPATPAAPTLVRFYLGPLDQPTALTIALDSCTTLVKSGHLAEADAACDRAVHAARTDRAERGGSLITTNTDEGLAAAYNNRAVLRYLQGEMSAAVADSNRAVTIAPSAAVASTAAFIDAAMHRTARND